MSKKQSSKPLEVKIATVVAVNVVLGSTDMAEAGRLLAEITGGQDDYFDHELAVIDLGQLEQDPSLIDWPALVELLRRSNLNPVAVRHAPASLLPALHQLGLSIDAVAARTAAPNPQQTEKPEKAPEKLPEQAPQAQRQPAATASERKPAPVAAPASPQATCMVIDTPVRSGQRIYARGSDLVVTAIVNAGAELIADGSIHVYAPLRGRALAGASGDAGARIFALAMEPELVSIAGMYRTFEDGLPKDIAQRPAEIRLEQDRLAIRPIGNERGA